MRAMTALLSTFPWNLVTARWKRCAWRLPLNIPLHFIDRDTEGYPLDHTPMPDSYAVRRIGHTAYCRAFMEIHQNRYPFDRGPLREKTMAWHLQELAKTGEKVLFVCGLSHANGILKCWTINRRPLSADGFGKRWVWPICIGNPAGKSWERCLFCRPTYERHRLKNEMPDRLQGADGPAQGGAEKILEEQQGKGLPHSVQNPQPVRSKLCLLNQKLVPDFYQLIVASRGAVDDNFAYEVWDLGSGYPWQTENPGLSVLRLRGEDLFLDQKRIRFHRQFKTLRRRLIPVPVKEKRRRRDPEKWKKGIQRQCHLFLPA
jgi:hypothetical protein